MFITTALKPQNLVQNTNSKTHLTNHYLGIRRGKNLLEVVKATMKNTNPHSHISNSTRYYTPLSISVNRLKERIEYIVNDLFYEPITIYQVKYYDKKQINQKSIVM